MFEPLYPVLSAEMQAFIRTAYGVLLFCTLAAAVPHAGRYFRSERWGGYAESSAWVNAIQNPLVSGVILAAWLVAAVGLVVDRYSLLAAGFNLVVSYYFFVRTRWRSVLRGMGAPGFITFWLGAAVFLLEVTSRHAPAARGTVLLMLQVDFALIMLSAGLYKLFAGYRQQLGMELGMVNPEWGYWPRFWSRWSPTHPLFRFLDEMAWGTEVACGLLMLIPATRVYGAIGILLSFIFIATQIRLGFLCEMVIVCALLFFDAGSIPGAAMASVVPAVEVSAGGTHWPLPLQNVLTAACWIYMICLIPVRAGMFFNQLRHRSLPAPWQRLLDLYANTFGLILWRVFTADVVNFFVRIWELPANGPRRLISHFAPTGPSRFAQVAESIVLTSVFTTLKYHPANRALFETRLRRYARTIPAAPGSRLAFEWVGVDAAAGRFAFVPAAEFIVEPRSGAIDEHPLADAARVRRVAAASPVHETAGPGSYAPIVR